MPRPGRGLRGRLCVTVRSGPCWPPAAPRAPKAVAQQPAPVPEPRPPHRRDCRMAAADPVADLIALSTRHFEDGQRELRGDT